MADDTKRVWDLMSDIDYCLLVTKTGQGLRSRPMSSIVDVEARTLHFLAGNDATAVEDLRRNGDVHLAYSNGSNRFVSVNGAATLSNDRTLIKRLWNVGAQAFWPAGPETADVSVITIDPSDAQFWDGDNTIVSTVKFVTGLATGTTPDMGDSGKVKL